MLVNAAVELVGTAAGETANPERIMPRAINSVIARIALFYVGSVFLLGLLLPYTTYKAGESPFVTFFSKIGVEGAGTIMNIVVLTAAFSSLMTPLLLMIARWYEEQEHRGQTALEARHLIDNG